MARLSGWVHSKRDHGGLLFIDLRDHYGMTQCVFPAGSPAFAAAEALRPESVITVTGEVVPRSAGTINPKLDTGGIELRVADLVVQSAADVLPFQVAGDQTYPEEMRLRYRFLDLRREKLQRNMILRAHVIDSIRRRMIAGGFNEFQTPILTVSSPRARATSWCRPGCIPASSTPCRRRRSSSSSCAWSRGSTATFQIAPCFRDEAGRADRTLMFYQLDVEMSFVTQEDVFAAMEPVMEGVFRSSRPASGGPARRSAASRTRRRCCDTAATSRTCATRW